MASSFILNSGRPNSTDEKDSLSSGHVRWFIFQETDETQPISKLSSFVIDKVLMNRSGRTQNC